MWILTDAKVGNQKRLITAAQSSAQTLESNTSHETICSQVNIVTVYTVCAQHFENHYV